VYGLGFQAKIGNGFTKFDSWTFMVIEKQVKRFWVKRKRGI